MTEVENLVPEHLRAIRGDMAKLANRMETLAAEMTAVRHHIAGMAALQGHDPGEVAAIKLRLDRSETRRELVQ